LIHAILFDLVGTLTEETSVLLNTQQGYYGLQVKAIHQSLEKDGIFVDWPSFRDQYEKIRNQQKERSKETLREYDMCKRVSDTLSFFNHSVSSASEIIAKAVDAYMNIYIKTLKIEESTCDLLRSLSAEYELGLVTNFAYPPGAHRILDHFAIRPFFRAILISGEVGWKKPSPHIFDIALTRLSVKPEKAAFVGDDYEADIVGAKNVGMKTVFLCKEPEYSKKTDITIGSLMELPLAVQRACV